MRLGEEKSFKLNSLTKFSTCKFEIGSVNYPLEWGFFEEQDGVRLSFNFTSVRNARIYLIETQWGYKKHDIMNGSYSTIESAQNFVSERQYVALLTVPIDPHLGAEVHFDVRYHLSNQMNLTDINWL